jgi:hypothetical protein
MRLAWLVAAALSWLTACVVPKPYDGLIPVDHEGAARRLSVLCHFGVGDDIARAACEATAFDPDAGATTAGR